MISADIFRGAIAKAWSRQAHRRRPAVALPIQLPTAIMFFCRDTASWCRFNPAGSRCTTAIRKLFVPNIFWAKQEDYRKATQRVYHAPGQASFIELPMVTTP